MATDDRAPLEQQSARLRLVGSAEPNLDAREAPQPGRSWLKRELWQAVPRAGFWPAALAILRAHLRRMLPGMAAGTWTVVRPRLTTTTQGGCASGRYRFRPQIAIGAGTAVAIETANVVLMPSDPLDILGDPALARDRA